MFDEESYYEDKNSNHCVKNKVESHGSKIFDAVMGIVAQGHKLVNIHTILQLRLLFFIVG